MGKRVIIDIDEHYDDILCITAIGHTYESFSIKTWANTFSMNLHEHTYAAITHDGKNGGFQLKASEKQGRWEDDPYVFKCSECHKWLVLERGDADMNFCPHCGAKMEGDAK